MGWKRFFVALVLIQQVLYQKKRELLINAMKEKWYFETGKTIPRYACHFYPVTRNK